MHWLNSFQGADVLDKTLIEMHVIYYIRGNVQQYGMQRRFTAFLHSRCGVVKHIDFFLWQVNRPACSYTF